MKSLPFSVALDKQHGSLCTWLPESSWPPEAGPAADCSAPRRFPEAAGRLVKARARRRSSAYSIVCAPSCARVTTALPVLRYSRLSSARDCDVRAVSRLTSNAAPARVPHPPRRLLQDLWLTGTSATELAVSRQCVPKILTHWLNIH